MTQTIQEALRVTLQSEGVYTANITEDWWQGLGAYGGISAGLIVRAGQASLGEGSVRMPRALHVLFTAPPANGVATLTVKTLRKGARVSFLDVRMEQEGKLVAHGTLTMGKPREGAARIRNEGMPQVPPADDLAPLPDVPQVPRYFEHLDIRPCLGSPPLSGSDSAMLGGGRVSTRGRSRPCVHCSFDGCRTAVIFRDAVCFSAGRFVTASYHFLESSPQSRAAAGESLLLRIRSWVCDDGYSDEEQHLWSASGVLLARANQVIAIG